MGSTQLAEAIKKNNHAVSLIEIGNIGSAIDALKIALKLSKEAMWSGNNDGHENNSYKKSSLDECIKQSQAHSIKGSLCSGDETRGGDFFYRCAISIPDFIGTSEESRIEVSIMIMFNLALAHQILVMDSHNSTNDMLIKPVKLYELVLQLQSDTDTESLVLTMATINNLGLAYLSLDDHFSASRLFECLLSTLMVLTDSRADQMSQFDGFFQSAFRYIFKPESAAAA